MLRCSGCDGDRDGDVDDDGDRDSDGDGYVVEFSTGGVRDVAPHKKMLIRRCVALRRPSRCDGGDGDGDCDCDRDGDGDVDGTGDGKRLRG